MLALFNDNRGWMMYLRFEGDAGFSTRNPNYEGPSDAVLRFTLENGQVDQYPTSWTYPSEVVFRALEQFIRTAAPPTGIDWHNDSGDGSRNP